MVLLGLLAPIVLTLALVANYRLFSYISLGTNNIPLPTTNTLISNTSTTTNLLQHTMTVHFSFLPEETLPNSTSFVLSGPSFLETTLDTLNDEFTIFYSLLAASPFFAILLGIIMFTFTILIYLSVSLLRSVRDQSIFDKKREDHLLRILQKITAHENKTEARLGKMMKTIASQREDIYSLHRDLEEALNAVTKLSESRFLERKEATQREECLESALEEVKNRMVLAERTVVGVINKIEALSEDHTIIKQCVVTRLAEIESRIEELTSSPMTFRTPRTARTEMSEDSRPYFTPIRTSILRNVHTHGDFRRSSHAHRLGNENVDLSLLSAADDSADENNCTLVNSTGPGSQGEDGNEEEEPEEQEKQDQSIFGNVENDLKTNEFLEETSRILAGVDALDNTHILTPSISANQAGTIPEDDDFETF